jgi:hypothetical protein
VCHGADDFWISRSYCCFSTRNANKADWQMIYYADAVHGFKQNTEMINQPE